MNALNTPAADGGIGGNQNDPGASSAPTEDLSGTWRETPTAGFGTGPTAQFGASTASTFGTGPTTAIPEQPLYEPLPYGTGFASSQPLGFGVGPSDTGIALASAAGSTVAMPEKKKSGSPTLAVAGVLSLGVAVWAILGGPVITPTVLLAGGLVLMVLVGLVMVIRR
ncbi:hypothetical protein NCCP2495_28710 [Dietzia sp. NCCP-2495]|uniref:hypothetical protein n=1 Tax=Dietzia sp. NCCP-2495 TaxID=2934675 RepID=UPI0022322D53|nr:hypothetical protein [Dietzia sp. NCCP-2495]GLB64991.1 hypothetical protein NCCP2495_28710 [Dietzia sp. NCCP-2495]